MYHVPQVAWHCRLLFDFFCVFELLVRPVEPSQKHAPGRPRARERFQAEAGRPSLGAQGKGALLVGASIHVKIRYFFDAARLLQAQLLLLRC